VYTGEFGYAMDNDKFIKQEVRRNWIRQKTASRWLCHLRGETTAGIFVPGIYYILYIICAFNSRLFTYWGSALSRFLVCIWFIFSV